MALSLEDATTPLTRQEVEESIYAVMAILGTDTTIWKPGAVTRTLVVCFSVMLAALSQIMFGLAQATNFRTARGIWLKKLAQHNFGLDVPTALAASGTIEYVNTSANVYVVGAGTMVARAPSIDKTYRNTTGFTIFGNSSGSFTVSADEPGTGSTIGAELITEIVTPALNGVTISNPTALVGVDEPTDAALLELCDDATGQASPNGPADAYAHFAKNAFLSDGSPAGITRVRVETLPDVTVNVYMATATGAAPGTVGDLATPLGAAANNVELNAVPIPVTANYLSATEEIINITYVLWMYSTGPSDDYILSEITSRLAVVFSKTPIGGHVSQGQGYLHNEILTAVIRGISDDIFRVELTNDDIPLTVNQVPVLGVVSGTVNRVKR